MQIMQSIISSIFAFLLSLLFILLFLGTGLAFGLFSDRIILSKVNESNYYNEVHQELNERAEKIITEAGLPSTVLTDVISLERVYIGGKYFIEDTLTGKDTVINTEKVREQLEQNINQYLTEEEVTKTEELEAGIYEIILRVEQEYKRGIQFQFIIYLAEYKLLFFDLMKIAVPVIVILSAFLCFLLVRMQQYMHKGVRYIAYATISSTSIVLITAAFLLFSGVYHKIEQVPDYYDRFLTSFLKWDIQVFLYLGGLGVLISILLITLVSYLKNNLN
jgi:hypothetical protein